MPDKEPKAGQRPNNIARIDARRGRAGARENKPCVRPANPYVGSTTSRERKAMLPNGEQPITFDDGFRVGDFEVYPKRLALVRNGNTSRVEPKVMAVLVHLAERADEVVTRDEFADEVWRGRVVSDEVLSRDISILRSQLGDDAKEPSYVLTIPRVGYRLIAKVRPLRDPIADPVPAMPEPTPTPSLPDIDVAPLPAPIRTEPGGSRLWRERRWAIVVAATLAIAILVAALIHFMTRPSERTIAVLPFVSRSDSPDDEYFSDGLSEEIMHALSSVAGISVVAKTSTFAFRNSSEDIRDIGRKLNAGSVIEGSVRRDGNRLRITAQMINANTGLQDWSETYDRRVADIFEIQNEIATAIAHRLVGTPPAGALPPAPTQDIEAYTLFLRANHLLRQRGAVQLTRAVELFQLAIARDPKFVRAYTGLAQAYTLQPSYTGTSERAGHNLALEAEARAEVLGESPARSSGMRAYIDFRSRQWQAAKGEFDVALAVSPNDADMLQWYSQYLASVGWMKRSRDAAETAVKADPLSPAANQRAGVVSIWANDAKAAAEYFSIAAEVGIEGPGLPEAWIAYLLSQGRIDEVRAALVETQRIRNQGTAWIDPTLAAVTKTGSDRDAVDALTREYRAGKLAVPMYVGALFYVGDVDALYAAMPDVVATGEPFDVELFFSENGRALRNDPRFIPLMTQLHLVEFWDREGWPDVCARTAQQIVCR
jgi:TolB-like protein/DNA-binding winged helix-turn-helix (wHTH) protein/Tfp pilus assembly protein PilF